MLHENLIFIIGSPRSGSTLLQRVLGSHTQIFTHPEPHLLTPLYYLGYYATVDKAPYDHINAGAALREFAQELPDGENDYLDALRAYASTLYERVLNKSGKAFFLDKTPAYALIAPFVAKLYPRAKYVVLTRHPLAIWHSYVQSFFSGDYALAARSQPLLENYVPAIAEFMRMPKVPYVHLRYEDLVQKPEDEARRLCAHLKIPFEPAMVNYGEHRHISKSYGDPINVEKHSRPVTDSLELWAQDLLANPDAQKIARSIIAQLNPDDLAAWGYPANTFWQALDRNQAQKTRRVVNSYRFKRQVLLRLRKNIQNNAFGGALRKIRYYCDVLLRQ